MAKTKNRQDFLMFDIETEQGPLFEIEGFLKPVIPTKTAEKKGQEAVKDYIEQGKAKQLEKAALSPLLGRVFSVCIADAEKSFTVISTVEHDEDYCIRVLFQVLTDAYRQNRIAIGWNVKSFDLPFIVRRALVLGIPIPPQLRPTGAARFFWPDYIRDLREIWSAGEYGQVSGSLDDLALAMGMQTKPFAGADYAKTYRENPEQARLYSMLEMNAMESLALRAQIIDPMPENGEEEQGEEK
jgi:uncharacterized protein YprB with RNaseH-like and TPR domain